VHVAIHDFVERETEVAEFGALAHRIKGQALIIDLIPCRRSAGFPTIGKFEHPTSSNSLERFEGKSTINA
jgi:hypothetical protein